MTRQRAKQGSVFAATGGANVDARRGLKNFPSLGCALLAMLLLVLTGCHKKAQVSRNSYPPPPPPQPASRSTVTRREPTPAPQARTLPRTDDNAVPTGRIETGMASWYAPNGRRSANGEVYDGNSWARCSASPIFRRTSLWLCA